jgi:hypothetical protein
MDFVASSSAAAHVHEASNAWRKNSIRFLQLPSLLSITITSAAHSAEEKIK